VPRNIDVFIPEIDKNGVDITHWPDTEARKGDIYLEFK
jgi:hypothetical protein